MSRAARDGPGGALLHPLPAAVIALLLLNDHRWKHAWAHPLPGHLSDVAGLAFFPLLLVALAELAPAASGRYRGPSTALLAAAIAATASVFAFVQVAPPPAGGCRLALGALQLLLRTIASLFAGSGLGELRSVAVTPNPLDLLALPALLIPAWLGAPAARGRSGTALTPCAAEVQPGGQPAVAALAARSPR